jgi:hypothetical protein
MHGEPGRYDALRFTESTGCCDTGEWDGNQA